MIQKEKELLLKDLYARLPYRVKFKDEYDENLQEIHYIKDEAIYTKTYPHLPYWIETIKPYLRPLSSMTEDEKKELLAVVDSETKDIIDQLKTDNCGIMEGKYRFNSLKELDWLNEHHFDYRTTYDESKRKWVSMIEKGLVLEAPEGMYEY